MGCTFSIKRICLLFLITTLTLGFCLFGDIYYSFIILKLKANPASDLSVYEVKFLRQRIVDEPLFSKYGVRLFEINEIDFINIGIERLYVASDPFLLLLASESYVRNGDFSELPEISARAIKKERQHSYTLLPAVFSVIGVDMLVEHVDIKQILINSDTQMVCALVIIANKRTFQEYTEEVNFMLKREDINENCKQRVEFILSGNL